MSAVCISNEFMNCYLMQLIMILEKNEKTNSLFYIQNTNSTVGTTLFTFSLSRCWFVVSYRLQRCQWHCARSVSCWAWLSLHHPLCPHTWLLKHPWCPGYSSAQNDMSTELHLQFKVLLKPKLTYNPIITSIFILFLATYACVPSRGLFIPKSAVYADILVCINKMLNLQAL